MITVQVKDYFNSVEEDDDDGNLLCPFLIDNKQENI